MAARPSFETGARRSQGEREKEDARMPTWDFESSRDKKRRPKRKNAREQASRPEPAGETKPKREPHVRRTSRMDVAGPRQFEPGQIVKGVVVAENEDGLLVDVGGKSEGLIPTYEFVDRSEMPAQGEEIEVAVVRIAEDDGTAILSKKSADYERVWSRILEAAEGGEVLDAMVTERVKGGLRVDLGVSGFVPASHVATRDVRNLDRFVGRSLRLKVLEADRERKKVVLSHRLVVEEEKRCRREETLTRLREGLVCEGKVRSLAEYGAFIDLGGVDGLLHVSEMAWGRVGHPSEVCKVGDTLRVVVLDVDTERNRISLGRRQILPDPWKDAARKLKPGALVQAKITRTVRTGAFAELADLPLEGFVPVAELSEKRLQQASDAVKEGDEVTLVVLKLRPDARRMTLSLRAAEQEKERLEYREYMQSQETAKPTLGDQFADVLGAVAEQAQAAEEAQEVVAAEVSAPGQEKVADEPESEEAAEAADIEEAEAEQAAEEEMAEAPETEAPEEAAATEDEPLAEEEAAEAEAKQAAEEEMAEAPETEAPEETAATEDEPLAEEDAAEEETAEEEAEPSEEKAAEVAQAAEDEQAAEEPAEEPAEEADGEAVTEEAPEANEVPGEADAAGGEDEADEEAAEPEEDESESSDQ